MLYEHPKPPERNGMSSRESNLRMRGTLAASLIYHYTTSGGLIGIISNQKLWATNVWFMNDTGEATFGTQAIVALLESKTAGSEFEKKTIELALGIIHRVRAADDFPQSYIACLSKHGDLLSQWRAYGGANGFSIGFDMEVLRNIGMTVADESKFTLREVSYDVTVHKNILNMFYHDEVEVRPTREHVTEESVATAFCMRAVQFAPALKDPAFQEEAEVRLQVFREASPAANIAFRDSVMGVTPYIEPPISMPGDEKSSAIREVLVGPQRHSAEAIIAVKQLLACNELLDVKVKKSSVPLRS